MSDRISLITMVKNICLSTTPRYDYKRQAWVQNGRYVRCAHPSTMNCQCYGRLHEGEIAPIASDDAPDPVSGS